MKKRFSKRYNLLLLLFVVGLLRVYAGDIKGFVKDADLNEPLMGAFVKIVGGKAGAVTDLDGNFTLRSLKKGKYTLHISYLSFLSQTVTIDVPAKGTVEMKVDLMPDDKQLAEVMVTARKNMELERTLLLERQNATLAIENLGAGEMSVKGISNAQEGVKKITGVSIAEAGQLIVRGLGDRYSTTTLNGLPIASPNPDNKLIPLDIFPASTIQNITVSKVYQVGTFADYSGAHVDISTKEGKADDFFNLSFSTGSKVGTFGSNFYQMNRSGSLFTAPSIDSKALNLPLSAYDEYVKTRDIFGTSFETGKTKALPDFGGNVGVGKKYRLAGKELSLLASLGMSTDNQTIKEAYVRMFEASGSQLSRYDYDSYAKMLKIAGLFTIGYTLRKVDQIGVTFFYARNAIDSYMSRSGTDQEGHHLLGSNQNSRIYSLQNYQLTGHHELSKKWHADWSGSYSKTTSDEPDRRQVMFIRQDDGSLQLFTLNQQETMRYFGALGEDEWAGDIKTTYHYGKNNKARAGITLKDKNRDYRATRFYYNVRALNPEITDIYHTEGYLNFDNVQNGYIVIDRKKIPRDSYSAGNNIYAGFIETDYYPWNDFLVNLGVRMEAARQWVNYFDDGGEAHTRKLNTNELFPALNMKYTLNKQNIFRFSASRTVTRPSFVEMAPFLYQESYGSVQIRGNAMLENGYNYNLDFRYELFSPHNSDMLAVTGYYKHLNRPIERIQRFAGGAVEHSFENAADGMAAGIEVEARKEIVKNLKCAVNASFMLTNVNLPDGGAYTNTERPLQGASPYLLNADISYTPSFSKNRKMSLSLLYNLQGERIHAVGISELGDVKQMALHAMDFVCSYQFSRRLSAKVQVKNLLNSDIVFRQEIPQKNKVEEIERFNEGVGLDFGLTYKF